MSQKDLIQQQILEVTHPAFRFNIFVYGNHITNDNIVDGIVNKEQLAQADEAVFVADLTVIIQLFDLWKRRMKRVEPFYAVKVNDDVGLLYTLASLGSGFDCASKDELQNVLRLGVHPDRIIYAHPCKHPSHLKYAAQEEIKRVTFDNEDELYKIKELCPEMEVILRIKTDDSNADWQMAAKFGCPLNEGKRLVQLARDLRLTIIGVSFHVGSGCRSPITFQQAIVDAKFIFEYAKSIGIEMNLLDIGGGFPGSMDLLEDFEKIDTMYYISDGKYGSLMYYPLEGKGKFRVIAQGINSGKTISKKLTRLSSVWGPTCCGTDCVMANCELPELEIGDWLIFEEMGAYSSSNATNFNGFAKPKVFYIAREKDLNLFNL